MHLEGNVAARTIFNLAAIREGVEHVLFVAFAFEAIAIVLSNLLLQSSHNSVGEHCQHFVAAMDADSGQFAILSSCHILPAGASQLA